MSQPALACTDKTLSTKPPANESSRARRERDATKWRAKRDAWNQCLHQEHLARKARCESRNQEEEEASDRQTDDLLEMTRESCRSTWRS